MERRIQIFGLMLVPHDAQLPEGVWTLPVHPRKRSGNYHFGLGSTMIAIVQSSVRVGFCQRGGKESCSDSFIRSKEGYHFVVIFDKSNRNQCQTTTIALSTLIICKSVSPTARWQSSS